MLGLSGTGGRRRLRIGALIAAVALAAGGLTLAGLAGADEQPSTRQASYPPNPCSPTKIIYAKITKHPRKHTTRRTARFKFKALFCNGGAEVPNATFKCKLDDGNYKKCSSPKRYRHLDRGKHRFKVKAKKRGLGTSDPAHYSWKIRR